MPDISTAPLALAASAVSTASVSLPLLPGMELNSLHHPLEQPSLWFELLIIAIVIAGVLYFTFYLKQRFNREKLQGILPYERASQLITPFLGLLIFLTIDLIIFGAFTRLSDSGLGCPDWPGCYTNSTPLFANHAISIEQSINPTGPVTLTKSWIEMIHRYFASSLGVLVIFLNYLMYRRKKYQATFFASKGLRHALLILALIIIQGIFGAWTVTYKLQPIIVSTHLILALFFLANLVWLYLNERRQLELTAQPSLHQDMRALNLSNAAHQSHRHLLKAFKIFFACLLLQIFFGAWVSTNYAVFGCTESLTCLSDSLTHSAFSYANWHDAFDMWRATNYNGLKLLEMPTLTGIHLTHRLGAVLLLGAYIYLYLRTHRLQNIALNVGLFKILPASSKKYIRLIAVLLSVQIITGVANIVLSHPLLAALLHTLGATLILVSAIFAYHPLHTLYHYHKNQ